jgi:AmpD protein
MPPPDSGSQPGLWQEGWYRFAHPLRSPNQGERPQRAHIDLIVLHSISLPPGQYGGDHVQQFFTNQLDWKIHPWFEQIRGLEVSAHFYIRRDGELWQFVSCDNRAWHAGKSFYQGRENCNDHSIGIELEGLEGDTFEPAQYETLARVCAALAQNYPITQVAGHEHVAPGRKQDPGRVFEWHKLQCMLGWSEQHFPAGTSQK